MHKIIFTLVISLGLTGQVLAKTDAASGQSKLVTCSACHGAKGISPTPNYPNLAGQGERYLFKQIMDIKSGARQVPEMMTFVRDLTPEDVRYIAAFYASQPAATGAAEKTSLPLGEQLYRAGNPEKGIPACAACHSPSGQGNGLAGFPYIGGQHAQYTAKQLRAFMEGERTNDGDTQVMQMIAEKLSNKEIEAVSNYIQGLGI